MHFSRGSRHYGRHRVTRGRWYGDGMFLGGFSTSTYMFIWRQATWHGGKKTAALAAVCLPALSAAGACQQQKANVTTAEDDSPG